MRTKTENKVTYYIYCINHFAERFKLSPKDSFNYLFQYGGLVFLEDFYDAEHLLSLKDTIEDLIVVCKDNGGYLQ